MEAPQPLPGRSIYNLDSNWTTQDGTSVGLDALAGGPIVAAMGYTTCKDICPAIVADMMWVEKHLPADAAARVHFAFFSFDSAVDTPARLKAYADEHGLDPGRWTLYHGDEDAVRELSLEWFARPNGARPQSVGAGAANGFGIRDMVGLVWEWTLDFDAYATTAESRDPNGKDNAQFCGGAAAGVADPTDYPAFMRYSMRASLKADYSADNLGFRCAGGAS